MKKTLLYALVAAFGLGGLADAVPASAAEAAAPAPRSIEQIGAQMAAGDVVAVRHHRVVRKRVVRRRVVRRPRGVFRSRTMARIHHRGRWCGKYVGRRCYYTPRVLRPFRRH